MDNAINYKFELFEGPLELLLSLVDKHKMKIDNIPIDLLCDQYMSYIREAQLYNIDLACEFTYMASELMLIKSRMLLPRDVKKDEDPRKPLVDAMLEYQKTKLAAAELSDMYGEYGGRMIKEQDENQGTKNTSPTTRLSFSAQPLSMCLPKQSSRKKQCAKSSQR